MLVSRVFLRSIACVMAGCVCAAAAHGEDVDVKQELAALRAEVAQLRAAQNETWLNERRAEEVKALIREVIADADTRAALAEGGVTAGHNKNFFIASEDGNFLLNFASQIQVRYIWFHDEGEETAPADDDESGFQIRRTKLIFFGHAFDPKLQFRVMGGFFRNTGDFQLEDAYVQYLLTDDLGIRLGQFRAPFLREEWVNSSAQTAAERSAVNEFFTVDFVQGVMLTKELGERVKVYGMVHDGRESRNVDVASDFTEIALSGRVEWLVAGEWAQFADYVTWSKDPVGVMLGAAIDYEWTEDGAAGLSPIDDFMQWTVDASIEAYPLFGSVAFVARHVNDDEGIDSGTIADPVTDADFDQYGLMAQLGVFIVPDTWNVFLRYEWLDTDGYAEVVDATYDDIDADVPHEQTIWTVGTNYYFQKHASKLTLDVLYAPDGIRRTESGLGLIETLSGEDVWVARAQYQFMF